jgi:hypothetical protein
MELTGKAGAVIEKVFSSQRNLAFSSSQDVEDNCYVPQDSYLF